MKTGNSQILEIERETKCPYKREVTKLCIMHIHLSFSGFEKRPPVAKSILLTDILEGH